MKKSVKVLMIAFLLCVMLVPIQASASAINGRLTAADTSNVRVALQMQEDSLQSVTSLRLCLAITVEEGTISDPAFQFDSSINSMVKDAAVSRTGNGYLIDIILSGKPEQKIFQNQGTAEIGTLVLAQASQPFRASVDFYKEGADGPAVYCVDSAGQTPLRIALSSQAVTVTNKQGGSDGPYYPGGPDQKPKPPGDSSDQTPPTQQPGDTQNPGQEQDASFDGSKKPKLSFTVKNGSRIVRLKWKKVAKADGYRIYQYDSTRRKYVAIKTIKNAKTTEYSVKLSYAATENFRIRAYALAEDGSKTFGHVSNTIIAVTAPKAVQGLAVQNKNSKKAVLTWNKNKKADGYKLVYSKKEDGKYKSLRVIKQAEKVQYTAKKTGGKNYFYKVRAYKIGSDGKRIYSKYSLPVRG